MYVFIQYFHYCFRKVLTSKFAVTSDSQDTQQRTQYLKWTLKSKKTIEVEQEMVPRDQTWCILVVDIYYLVSKCFIYYLLTVQLVLILNKAKNNGFMCLEKLLQSKRRGQKGIHRNNSSSQLTFKVRDNAGHVHFMPGK